MVDESILCEGEETADAAASVGTSQATELQEQESAKNWFEDSPRPRLGESADRIVLEEADRIILYNSYEDSDGEL